MPATHSAEGRALDFMNRRDCSTVFLGQFAALHNLSGLSQQRLSQAFSDAKPLDNQKAEELRSLISDLDGFCHSVAPIPVSLRNPHLLKELVDDFRAKKKASEEEFVVYVWALKMDAFSYFKTLQNGQPVRTVSLHEAAAFSTMDIANEAVKRLKILKIDSRADSFTNARRTQSSLISNVEQFSQVGL
jgi:hypothetical protein